MADNTAISTTVMQSSQLEQYLLLAKTAKGAAAAELIKQVTEAPGVHVFGELLDMPNIQELANGPHSSYLNLLNLFAFGTYATYHENKSQFPPLTPAMITKLRHLTIVSLATKTKVANIKKNLKVQSQDVDDQMGADGRDDSHMDKPGKKGAKSKGCVL
ncbi:hypothetical protein HPB50_018281 [Hyalomma asiaticum]|uniref:Uncharacterized protein n=1 Tax=Hyalomma asiaticum TaxID=266040 RepID=A0ACB7SL04_HYAAI|nr:hypothetical protein HPB50_018281 [Hyalomma asiaticum]